MATAVGYVVELGRRVRGGDAAALGALVDLLAPRALFVARHVAADEAAAEEAVEAAFAQLWRDGPDGDPTAWLLRRVHDLTRRPAPVAAPARAQPAPVSLAAVPEPVA